MAVQRIHIEKKPGFDIEAAALYRELREHFSIHRLKSLRILYRYDVQGLDPEQMAAVTATIFSEPPVDLVHGADFRLTPDEHVLAVEYLPGQYDQRADSAAQAIQIVTRAERPLVRTAKVMLFRGALNSADLDRIRTRVINPVDSRRASMELPDTLSIDAGEPRDVPVLSEFNRLDRAGLRKTAEFYGLAMNDADLEFCRDYFLREENRPPTLTEIKLLDTYWSDHCRHTTFWTRIDPVRVSRARQTRPLRETLQRYRKLASELYPDSEHLCLMEIAQAAQRWLEKKGLLGDVEKSSEINACSLIVPLKVNGEHQEWLVMFKNETHNHPTEIEPYGGAATCLGGAIRDPLSGRAWVYQAMRISGSADPRRPVKRTMPGKLPQRLITTEAARGFSAYGNQVGLATGQVVEIYDPGYEAKRMEVGAVIAAAPRNQVRRLEPRPGDLILLVGGRTGRDGIGGATGSSKAHGEDSLSSCGSEVQKGDPLTERKLQRLFRDPRAAGMIRKCNDFGAGGVAVAIGELAPGLEIDLDAVPKKYAGLDGTEIALSESQERMAVVLDPADLPAFRELAAAENLECSTVARVSADNRLRMKWRGRTIVDLSRRFLDSNGVSRNSSAAIRAPRLADSYFSRIPARLRRILPDLEKAWLNNLSDLNTCSQKGLIERFDSSIGAATLLSPLGGKYQLTPAQGMAARLPLIEGETDLASLMTFAFNPGLSRWSPYHGALYAVLEAAVKTAACGGDFSRIRLSLQEYFGKPGEDPHKWGSPLAAMLGALQAQLELGLPAIGGKDSMSGTFRDISVPPTLIAFAVSMIKAENVISPEFKKAGSHVARLSLPRDEFEMPDWTRLRRNLAVPGQLADRGLLLAAQVIGQGGLAAAVSKMAFGNMIGLEFTVPCPAESLFRPEIGSLVLEIDGRADIKALAREFPLEFLGKTSSEPRIIADNFSLELDSALAAWTRPLESVFPTRPAKRSRENNDWPRPDICTRPAKSTLKTAVPRVLIPVFPGTNCEYDTAAAFSRAGGKVQTLVFRNLSVGDIKESLDRLAAAIADAQIIALPGGFSAGDEPEGAGKFIAAVFRNPGIREALDLFLRRGLMLGICNGFQALIKLGLLPGGEMRDLTVDSPTLTFNTIGRHVANMARIKVVSSLSPWFNACEPGEIRYVPISHGEGRLTAKPVLLAELFRRGQVTTRYVNHSGEPALNETDNPNGSMAAVESICSPDGRILGRMGHPERTGPGLFRNLPPADDQGVFQSGINYFR